MCQHTGTAAWCLHPCVFVCYVLSCCACLPACPHAGAGPWPTLAAGLYHRPWCRGRDSSRLAVCCCSHYNLRSQRLKLPCLPACGLCLSSAGHVGCLLPLWCGKRLACTACNAMVSCFYCNCQWLSTCVCVRAHLWSLQERLLCLPC
jgi:hypothetical protein